MPATSITIGSELDGFHVLEDQCTHQIKLPFHSLHLTFTRAADTVVVAQLGNGVVVVEEFVGAQATCTEVTRNQVYTVSGSASVFYYCQERDAGGLYVDQDAVIMLHYGPAAPATATPPSPRKKYAGQLFEEETDRSMTHMHFGPTAPTTTTPPYSPRSPQPMGVRV